jgi:hypothetical protein
MDAPFQHSCVTSLTLEHRTCVGDHAKPVYEAWISMQVKMIRISNVPRLPLLSAGR